MMNKLLVEFLGTVLLVFVVLATGNWLAIGLTLAIAVFLGGKISGGAFNPAVALSFYMKKSIGMNDLVMYVVAQLIGAVAAFFIYQNTKKFL